MLLRTGVEQIGPMQGRQCTPLLAAPLLDLHMVPGQQRLGHADAAPSFRPRVVWAIEQTAERRVEAVERMAHRVVQHAGREPRDRVEQRERAAISPPESTKSPRLNC